jgi:hypothetical protein
LVGVGKSAANWKRRRRAVDEEAVVAADAERPCPGDTGIGAPPRAADKGFRPRQHQPGDRKI